VKKYLKPIILTFVYTTIVFHINFASSAPIYPDQKPPTPADTVNQEESVPTTTEFPDEIKNYQIATPPPTHHQHTAEPDVFYAYPSALNPRLGIGSNTELISEKIFYHFFGIQYSYQNTDQQYWETGIDVMNDGGAIPHFGLKWVWNRTSIFRPYFKMAGGILLYASDSLAGLLKTENLLLRPSSGFEYFLQGNSSARLDVDWIFHSQHVGAQVAIGYTWAW